MAHLRQQGEIFHLIYYTESGDRKSFSLKTTKKKEAEALLNQFNAQQVVALPFEIYANKPKILFSDAVKLFLESRETKETTKDNYDYAARSWRINIGDKYISDYTREDCNKFKMKLQAEKKSPVTFRSYSIQLHIIFNWLVEKKYLAENPIVRQKQKGKLKRRVNPLPLWQLEVIKRDLFLRGMVRHCDMVQIIFLCALRISEIITMEYSDFDLERKVVYVRNQKGKRMDEIPMLKDMEEFFSQLDLAGTGKMFHYSGRHSLKSFWNTVNNRYGFKNTIHSIRKARGSQLATNGILPLHLRDFMRHTDIRTTLEYYTEIDQDKARIKMNELMNF